MPPTKTLEQRVKELQARLATPADRQEFQELESRHRAARGRLRPPNMSVITCILIHEREKWPDLRLTSWLAVQVTVRGTQGNRA
jgi:hypothetical protein